MSEERQRRAEGDELRIHYLKIWPEPFTAVADGRKNFELRVNDRGFELHDMLVLREYDPELDVFTGRELEKHVTYMIRGGEWGLPDQLCILGWGTPCEP
jgi:hypothetical protein